MRKVTFFITFMISLLFSLCTSFSNNKEEKKDNKEIANKQDTQSNYSVFKFSTWRFNANFNNLVLNEQKISGQIGKYSFQAEIFKHDIAKIIDITFSYYNNKLTSKTNEEDYLKEVRKSILEIANKLLLDSKISKTIEKQLSSKEFDASGGNNNINFGVESDDYNDIFIRAYPNDKDSILIRFLIEEVILEK